jgi:hypothetical protein
VLQHGLERFRDGLSKAMDNTCFFPDPNDVADACEAMARSERISIATRKYLSTMGEAKMTWLRDYLEDEANGIERKPLTPELRAVADALEQRMSADLGVTFSELRIGVGVGQISRSSTP